MDAKEAGFLALALSQQCNGGFNQGYSARTTMHHPDFLLFLGITLLE